MKKLIVACLCMFQLFNIHNSSAQTRHIVTSDSVNLYITVRGQGIPCLYIHGGPGSGSYWLEKLMGNFLDSNFQMIYLDQRGVGRSSSPVNKDYSMDRMVQDFEEVRQALHIKKWLTIGHSFGGLMQMAYTLKKPQSIMGMIMIDCTLSLDKSFCNSWIPHANTILGIKDSSKGCPENRSILVNRMGKLVGLLKKKNLFWKMTFSNQKNDSIFENINKEIPNWNYDFSNNAINIDDYWVDYTSQTSNIKAPTLFFYGTKDWMIGPNFYKYLAFSNVLFKKYNGGHMPFLEGQAELEKSIIRFKKTFINK